MDLEDILSDEEPEKTVVEQPAAEAPPAEAAEQPAPVEKTQSRRKDHQDKEFAAQGLERDANGQWKKKEAAVAEAPAAEVPAVKEPPAQPEMTAKEKAFLAQATDERRKRQELEARLRVLESGKPPEPAKTFWDDPEGAMKAHEQRTNEAIINTRLQTAEAIARGKYADFDEKIASFKEHLDGQPPAIAQSIAQKWLSDPDPAGFAYNFAKTQMELKEAGDLPALRASIEAKARADERAKVEAEYKAKEDAAKKQREAIPGSLSNARALGGNAVPTWSGPTSLDNILSGKD